MTEEIRILSDPAIFGKEKYMGFVNFSNHPSALWSAKQTEAARKWGDITDVKFPPVPADTEGKIVKRNVLLLSMSTLYNFKKNRYQYDKKSYFVGYSQLEPGTKLVLNQLADEGNRLDSVIVIHSKECEDPLPDSVKERIHAEMKLDEKDVAKLSSNEFYKRRILQYCNEPEPFRLESEGADVPEKETWKEHLSKEGDDWIQFIPMMNGKDGIYSCLPTVLDKIIGESKPEDVYLWVDTQGGRRNETFVMNCVINMLHIRKVNIRKYYAVDFNQSREKNAPQPMIDVTLNNIILDLVSGMEMFVSVARADKLREYYDKYKEIKGVNQMPEQKVVDKIGEVADAIAICNMGIFGSKLQELNQAIASYEKQMSDPIFQYFVEDLKREYGSLLDKNHKISDEIIWCENHKLYQQALTLTEAQLPKQIFDEWMFYNRVEVKREYADLKGCSDIKDRYLYENMDHYVFGEWWHQNQRKVGRKGTAINNDMEINCATYSGKLKPVAKFTMKYRKEMTLRQQINLIKAYTEVKNLRNEMNHGNSKKTTEDVTRCIECMLDAINIE